MCERGILPFHLRGAARAAGRRISAGTPTGSVARRHGNADLRSAQPRGSAAGETDLKQRHGPYSNGYFNRSGGRCGTSRQSAVRGSPACGGRCRPPPGELAGGRRSKPFPRFNVSGDTPFAAVRLAGRSVVGAGFALPRDAGRRPPPGELAGAPCPRDSAWWRTAEREKNKWQRTPFAARDFGGKCERGDSSLSQDGNDQSELAAARRRRAREFRLPARSAGRTPDGAPTPSRTTTESYSRSRPRPGTARP